MLIDTDLEGKINNLSDFKSEALTPVFEAIVNSIQAIEERKLQDKSQDRGEITVRINREIPQLKLIKEDEKKEEPKIRIFEVEDNGIGFDEKNYKSFKTSDSIYKKQKGGKGIGHLSWLKAFEKTEIKSIYSENGNKKLRCFKFTKDWVVPMSGNDTVLPNGTPQKTIVQLIGFKEAYRRQPSAYKTTEKIAQRILEHLLSYYIKKSGTVS